VDQFPFENKIARSEVGAREDQKNNNRLGDRRSGFRIDR
jgi:hypothetical protein